MWDEKLQLFPKHQSPGPGTYKNYDFTEPTHCKLTKGKLSNDQNNICFRFGTASKYRPDLSLEDRKFVQQKIRFDQFKNTARSKSTARKSRYSTPSNAIIA